MRTLLAIVLVALFAPLAHAVPTAYDLYLLACDSATDCQRVANVELGADGQKNDRPTPGLNVRIEQLSTVPEGVVVHLVMSLNPVQLAASDGQAAKRATAGHISIEVDSAIMRHNYYSPLVVFSTTGKVYQLWGRQVIPVAPAKDLAQR